MCLQVRTAEARHENDFIFKKHYTLQKARIRYQGYMTQKNKQVEM